MSDEPAAKRRRVDYPDVIHLHTLLRPLVSKLLLPELAGFVLGYVGTGIRGEEQKEQRICDVTAIHLTTLDRELMLVGFDWIRGLQQQQQQTIHIPTKHTQCAVLHVDGPLVAYGNRDGDLCLCALGGGVTFCMRPPDNNNNRVKYMSIALDAQYIYYRLTDVIHVYDRQTLKRQPERQLLVPGVTPINAKMYASRGELFVLDLTTCLMHVVDPNTRQTLRVWGQDSGLNLPQDFCVVGDEVWIADIGQPAIKAFDRSDGHFLQQIEMEDGAEARALGFDGQHLWVSCQEQREVRCYI